MKTPLIDRYGLITRVALLTFTIAAANAQSLPVADPAVAPPKTSTGPSLPPKTKAKKSPPKKIPAKRRKKKPVSRKPGPDEGIRAKGEAFFGGSAPAPKKGAP